jgi:hypothetical protein
MIPHLVDDVDQLESLLSIHVRTTPLLHCHVHPDALGMTYVVKFALATHGFSRWTKILMKQ